MPQEKSKQDLNDAQLSQLRKIVLGQQNEHVSSALKQNAREIVGEVFSEAMHDRQSKDNSVNNVLLPLVESSVEKSIANQNEKMVGALYPIVGRLVRKSVTAFLNEFLEKTNELIESSFTLKGLKWRIRAWQSGVKFSEYVASQTFVFRVEQVLLIQNEAGLLLRSVSRDQQDSADADMVSGMLTAINDFVADSFNSQTESTEQGINIVKTDDFNLVVKRGPRAMLVAAVTGNMPQSLLNKLQVTLEYIHRIYTNELLHFSGDVEIFEPVEQQLRECLITEIKPSADNTRKKPWLAWLLVFALIGCLLVYGYVWWQQDRLMSEVKQLQEPTGVLITKVVKSGWSKVELEVLRDPSTPEIQTWLTQSSLNTENLIITEKHFFSVELPLVKKRLNHLLKQYPGVTAEWQGTVPRLQGKITSTRRLSLGTALASLPGLNNAGDLLANVSIIELDNRTEDSPEILKALLELNAAKVDRTELEFEQSQSELSELSKEQLKVLAYNFQKVVDLATKQQLSIGLIIMGASDPIGNKGFNQRLSKERAEAAKTGLVELGIEPGYLNAIGLGVVESSTTGKGARKVLFNVIYFDTE
jgi:outer membrane protein OmpA-like peptidoglycan-associated protein